MKPAPPVTTTSGLSCTGAGSTIATGGPGQPTPDAPAPPVSAAARRRCCAASACRCAAAAAAAPPRLLCWSPGTRRDNASSATSAAVAMVTYAATKVPLRRVLAPPAGSGRRYAGSPTAVPPVGIPCALPAVFAAPRAARAVACQHPSRGCRRGACGLRRARRERSGRVGGANAITTVSRSWRAPRGLPPFVIEQQVRASRCKAAHVRAVVMSMEVSVLMPCRCAGLPGVAYQHSA